MNHTQLNNLKSILRDIPSDDILFFAKNYNIIMKDSPSDVDLIDYLERYSYEEEEKIKLVFDKNISLSANVERAIFEHTNLKKFKNIKISEKSLLYGLQYYIYLSELPSHLISDDIIVGAFNYGVNEEDYDYITNEFISNNFERDDLSQFLYNTMYNKSDNQEIKIYLKMKYGEKLCM